MKFLRILILLSLVVLLPVRGVVAAAMPCAPMALQSGTQAHLHDHPSAHTHAHEAGRADMPHGHVAGHHGDGKPGGVPDKCHLCCDLCSVTPFASIPPTVSMPPDFLAIFFPALRAPPPSFLSEGQERPPRTT